jgi:hypothetical protein
MSDETLNWARKKGFEPSKRGELVQSGPIKKQLGGKVSTFTKGLDGENVPYEGPAFVDAVRGLRHARRERDTWFLSKRPLSAIMRVHRFHGTDHLRWILAGFDAV